MRQITGEEQFAMKGLALDKYSLQKVVGLVAGIPIGVVLGPLVFTPMGVPAGRPGARAKSPRLRER